MIVLAFALGTGAGFVIGAIAAYEAISALLATEEDDRQAQARWR